MAGSKEGTAWGPAFETIRPTATLPAIPHIIAYTHHDRCRQSQYCPLTGYGALAIEVNVDPLAETRRVILEALREWCDGLGPRHAQWTRSKTRSVDRVRGVRKGKNKRSHSARLSSYTRGRLTFRSVLALPNASRTAQNRVQPSIGRHPDPTNPTESETDAQIKVQGESLSEAEARARASA